MKIKQLNDQTLDELYTGLSIAGFARPLLEVAKWEELGPPPPDGVGDITSAAMIGDHDRCEASLIFRTAGVLSGVRALGEVLGAWEAQSQVSFIAQEGDRIEAGGEVARYLGLTRDILAMERIALNLVGRMSGIATRTAEYVAAVEGTKARIFDTRKTTPGLRAMEKFAVRCGGGFCHRMGLFDAMLIKDNHLAGVENERVGTVVAAGVAKARAIAAVRGVELTFVECEVDNLDQLTSILRADGCGLGIVLLDNMTIPQMYEAVAMRNRSGLPIELEASGGVTLDTVRGIAETGVDRISVGAITHGAASLDVSLEFR